MNRRDFCRLSALAAGFFAAAPGKALAKATRASAEVPVRITVARRMCLADLQALYLCDPEEGQCSAFKPGDTFTARGACPEGFCPLAWQTISRVVENAAGCPTANASDGRTLMVSCPDGTRPVVFRVERLT